MSRSACRKTSVWRQADRRHRNRRFQEPPARLALPPVNRCSRRLKTTAGVLEVVEDDAGGTYRAVYTVKFAEAVFVLHCFQKKSKRGIAMPKADMNIIRARLKVVEALAQELRNAKTNR